MLRWIKADFKAHWATWIGFGGLLVIGIPMFLLIKEPIAERLVLMLLGWIFCCMGLFWEAQAEKYGVYMSDEEMNKPYNDWEGLYIWLPYLPTIRRKKKERSKLSL